MARPKSEPKTPIHSYIPTEVHDYLVAKLAGTQSLSSYILQKSGIIAEYRAWRNDNSVTPATQAPALVLEARTCETCTLIQCDPSCPMLAQHENTY